MDLEPAQESKSQIESVTGSLPKAQETLQETSQEISPQLQAADLQKQLNLEPTTIVLAKVKGYRAWPAMVLDEAILPENVRTLKPKTIKLAKKTNTPVIVVPVRFFSDDTYIWIKSCDLKPLSKEEIDGFLLKRQNSKKDILIDAYRLAQNPPDMFEFNTWGSRGPPEPVESSEEEVAEEPKRKVLKLSIKLKKPSSASSSSSKKSNGNGTGLSKKASSKLAPKQAKSSKQTAKPIKNEATSDFLDGNGGSVGGSLDGFDSDWGLDYANFDMESGDYIFDDERGQRDFVDRFPKATDLVQSLENSQNVIKGIHENISPLLIAGELQNEKKIITKLRDLEKLVARPETPLIAFTKSPLFRVLLLMLHKPKDEFEHQSIRASIQRVFDQVNLQVCEVSLEDLIVKTKENTPISSESKQENAPVVLE